MYKSREHGSRAALSLFSVFSVAMALGSAAHGDLLHRYSFNDGTAADSVGTAHGVLVAPASISSGVLNPTGGGRVTLPDQATTGVTGDFTIEMWYRFNGGGGAQISYSFGNDTANYLLSHPAFNGGHTVECNGPLLFVRTSNAPVGVPIHLVATYRLASRTLSMYVNGILGQSLAQSQGLPFNLQTTAAGRSDIGGRGAWNDPSLNGTIDEFRIWGHALTAEEVTQHGTLGPDVCPPPLIIVPPADGVTCEGGRALISVEAAGSASLRYQWQGEVNQLPGIWVDIADGPMAGIATFSGTQSATMLITGASANAAGRYRVVVTNACGSTTSNPATFGISCPMRADVAGVGGTPGCDGQLTADDIVYYLDRFFANSAAVADLVGLGGAGGPDGLITTDDLVAFLSAFFAGCP